MPQIHPVDPASWDVPQMTVVEKPEIAVPVPADTEYVTADTLKPYIVAMLRGVWQGINGALGAIGAYAVAVSMAGNPITGTGLGVSALIGFCFGWGGRSTEGITWDQFKAKKV